MPRVQALALVPHPAARSAAVQSIVVHVQRSRGRLRLRYVLSGELSRLRIPAPRPAGRADGLWRHTCFEAFLAEGEGPAYRELNFSPSGAWAAYAFAGYRSGGAPLEGPAPEIRCRRSPGELVLEAQIAGVSEARLRLGLSAVVEEGEGDLTYWALRHPAAGPDFHDRASFALELDEVRH